MTALLALDLSTHVGVAYFAHRGAKPALDTWHAPRLSDPDRLGVLFKAFEDWLRDQIDGCVPDLLCFEAPILPFKRVFQKQRAIRLSYGFAASAERVACELDLRCIECPVSTVKLRLAGHGHAKKHQMIAAATRLGYEPGTEHEADAIGVALVGYDHIDPPQPELVLR